MRSVPRAGLLSVALGLLLVVPGCTMPEGPPTVGDPLPELAYPTMERSGGEGGEDEVVAVRGDTVRLADYRGRVVLVNLWATWCGPCRFETPYLQELYEEYGDRGFEIVGISTDSRSSLNAVEHFTSENSVTYDILLDPPGESLGILGAFGLPINVLVDREGVIRWMLMGPILEGDEEFLTALRTLLEEGS